MPRIDLLVTREFHAPALAIGHRLVAVRMFADLTVATSEGWSRYRRAVVDTGAPVSMFPPAIWRQARYRALGRVRIGGIARREECRIPAILAEIECMLSDGERSLGPFRMYACLAEVEDAPTLVGISGFTERGVLRADTAKDRAFLRMP